MQKFRCKQSCAVAFPGGWVFFGRSRFLVGFTVFGNPFLGETFTWINSQVGSQPIAAPGQVSSSTSGLSAGPPKAHLLHEAPGGMKLVFSVGRHTACL